MQMNKVKIYSNKIPDDVLEMAQYTYEHVPLYADLAAKASKSCLDFEMLPIVGKDIYMSAEGMYLSDEYTDNDSALRRVSAVRQRKSRVFYSYLPTGL